MDFNSRRDFRYPAKNTAGFTLLEVMVSVAVIAVVLVSIIRLQGQTIGMNETIRFYTLAPMLAESRLAEIVLNPEAAEMSDAGDFGEDYPGYAWKVDVTDVDLDVFESPLVKMKQIDVAIDFNSGQLKFSLRHFLCDDTGADDA